MNKNEYWQTVNKRTDPVYKKVHAELEKWKKENGGLKKWNEFRKALASGDITFETHPATVFINKEDHPCC